MKYWTLIFLLLIATATASNDIYAIGANDGSILIYDANSCVTVQSVTSTGMSQSVNNIIPISSSVFAACSTDAKVSFFNTADYSLISSFDTQHSASVNKIAAFASGSDYVLVTASNDTKCKVWTYSPASATLVTSRIFTSHSQPVNALRVLWDGRIMSGGNDNKIFIWDSSTGSASVTLSPSNQVYSLDQLSSTYIVAGYSVSNLEIWDITSSSVYKSFTSYNKIKAVVTITSTQFIACNIDGYSIVYPWTTTSSGGTSNNFISTSGSNMIIDVAVTINKNILSVGPSQTSLTVKSPSSSWGLSSGSSTKCTISISKTYYSAMAFNPFTYSQATTTAATTTTPTTTVTVTGTTTTTSSTTTSSTTTTTVTTVASSNVIAAVMASLENKTVDFTTLTTAQTVAILSSGLDASNCLVNCSNKGACGVSNGQFVCTCFGNYTGPSCSSSSDPCSSYPCLNNGNCTALGNSSNTTDTFTCACDSRYYSGIYCQVKINLCQNVTCSGHGDCLDQGTSTLCKCHYMYSGTNCEIASSQQKTTQTVTSIATWLAIITIVLFYLFVVLLDLIDLFIKHEVKRKVKIPKKTVKYFYTY